MPSRIQRKRTAGWRMPEGAVYVGRPTQWGNPYIQPVKDISVVELYRRWLTRTGSGIDLVDRARRELAGKDLACWCPLDRPCHADVLLELANPVSDEDRRALDEDSRFVDTQDASNWYQENPDE